LQDDFQDFSPKEIHSLSQQVRDAYGANIRMENPCRLVVAVQGEKLRKLIDAHHAHQSWSHFQIVEESFEKLNFPHVMYLSSDAEKVLESVPEGATIVIGGLVDRNRHKGATHASALRKNVSTFRLPVEAAAGKKPLTSNQVVALVCRHLETGSWARAVEVIPEKRKKEKFQKKSLV
jgi:tRNA (guanine9-N1)-methyltransferase